MRTIPHLVLSLLLTVHIPIAYVFAILALEWCSYPYKTVEAAKEACSRAQKGEEIGLWYIDGEEQGV